MISMNNNIAALYSLVINIPTQLGNKLLKIDLYQNNNDSIKINSTGLTSARAYYKTIFVPL